MKKLFTLLMLTSLFAGYSFAKDFEFTPINIDFKGVEAKGDTIIAFGSHGSAMISYDDAENWEQVQIFENGIITQIFFLESSIAALNLNGQIHASVDGGISWNYVSTLEDSILYSISANNKIFIRTKNRLLKMNSRYEIENEAQIETPFWWGFQKRQSSWDKESMIFFKDHLYCIRDTSLIIKYNEKLIPVDSLIFNSSGTGKYETIYRIFCDNSSIFVSGYDKAPIIYKLNDNNNLIKYLKLYYNEEIFKNDSYPYYLKIINNEMYCLNKFFMESGEGPFFYIYKIINSDSVKKLNQIDCSVLPDKSGTIMRRISLNDFEIKNDRVTVVADGKFISTSSFNDNETKRISDIIGINLSSDFMPDKIGKSSYLYSTEEEGLYRSDDNMTTFYRVIGEKTLFDRSERMSYRFKYFDNKRKIFFMGGSSELDQNQAWLFSSENYGNSFNKTKLDSVYLSGSGAISNLNVTENLISIARNTRYKKHYTKIYQFDHDFNLLRAKLDTNYALKFIHSNTLSEIIAITDVSTDYPIYDLRYSMDGGDSWEVLKSYDNYSTDTIEIDPDNKFVAYHPEILGSEQIELYNKNYFLIFSSNRKESIFTLDAVDLETKQLISVYRRFIPTDEFNINTAATSHNDTAYINIGDTLFVTTDLFDHNKWSYYVLPHNGKISGKFKKFDDKFFALYQDEVHDKNLYWIKLPNQPNSVELPEIIKRTYFYYTTPYPIPARTLVTSKIYCDKRYDIKDAEISIYNIYGEKLEDDQNITLDKINSYSGFLRWNCSGFNNGIYFIKIEHGTNVYHIKVIISK